MIRPICYLIISCFFAIANAGEKRALVVAVGAYPANSGWHNLNSENDARLMHTLLQNQGFEDRNITILADEKATKSAIIQSFEKLLAQSNKGDVLVFHFSGHGQQITDESGDELDGYDEALIPYDARKTALVEYRGAKHLTDDELNKLLNRLREKVGKSGDVIFFLDACHSGTATRASLSDAVYRGTDLQFGSIKQDFQPDLPDAGKFDEQQFNSTRGSAELSPFVIISASGQQELNMEVKDANKAGYGSLTFALGKSLANNNEKLSYTSLFDLLRNEMWAQFGGRHQQSPQLEGDADRLLFAGQAVIVPEYCRIISVVNSEKAIIDFGEINGLSVGTEIDFHRINTIHPEKAFPIAKGMVTKAGITESEISFAPGVGNNKLTGAWGFITKRRFAGIYPDIQTMRADMIRRSWANEPLLNVVFEFVDPKSNTAFPNNHQFYVGDKFMMRLTNNGTKDAFFQVIDIQPDNQVNLLFDLNQLSTNDLFIKAGQTKIISKAVFTISEPAGIEMFKLIASEKQLDLSAIKTKSPSTKRNTEGNEFENLINRLFDAEDPQRAINHFSKVNIFTHTFTINKK